MEVFYFCNGYINPKASSPAVQAWANALRCEIGYQVKNVLGYEANKGALRDDPWNCDNALHGFWIQFRLPTQKFGQIRLDYHEVAVITPDQVVTPAAKKKKINKEQGYNVDNDDDFELFPA